MPKGANAGEAQARASDSDFARVTESFAGDPRVTRGDGKGFGSGALKVNGRIFSMISSKGEFVVKLPRAHVDELVAAGQGERFNPGHGRVMREWLVVRAGKDRWVELARQACEFVGAASDGRRGD